MSLHMPKKDIDVRAARVAAHQKAYKGPVLIREVADKGPGGIALHANKHVHCCQTFWKADFGSESVEQKAAGEAALVGYNVPDEDGNEAQTEQASDEEAVLQGDVHKLSANQRRALLCLGEARQHSRFKLKQISLSFSGASVFFFSPSRKDGTPMPSSVLKFDVAANVKEEIELTERYGKLFGLTTPKVKDSQFLEDVSEDEPCAVMQIDLCGGIFGLPEFASAPPVLTFASVIQGEFTSGKRQTDVVPIVNEALTRRMLAFTMSTRSVRKENLAKMYKIVRFVGHGILNRAVEGAKRSKHNAALGFGFLTPPDIDDLDPEGKFVSELCGKRSTIKRFFQEFIEQEQRFNKKFDRQIVCGLAHNDLHGGNLLLDSQGLVWLIDFATVKDNVHVLMDLSKFLASCLFLYLEDNVNESHIQTFAKLLFATPDATTALPLIGGEQLKSDPTATFVLELLTRIRHCLCIYEIGDDVPDNDGVPFALAFFSWSARMLSYSEPSMHQKTRASFFALAGAQRVMWEAGVDVGPTALEWIEQYRTVWEGQKGRRLSTSATHVQVASFEFESDFPRYLAQIGTAEAWSTDFLTREKVHVTDHCIKVDVKFSGRIFPRSLQLPKSVKIVCEKLRMVHQQYLPEVLSQERYQGRVFVIGDSGSGKTLMTKQLFSEVAQQQLLGIRDEPGDMAGTTRISGMNLIPVRTPLIDLARQLEANPDLPLGADPICDLLSEWMQRKHGHDSIPHKLVYTVRNWCLGAADRASRRTSVLSASEGEDATREKAIGDPQHSEDIKALFLLFDGLDEAASSRLQVLEFIRSILQSEPSHLCVLTSRPGNLGPSEYDLLASLAFVSFRMGALTLPQAEDVVQRTLTRAQEAHETISAIRSSVSDPGYSSLRENPLILTLLIHVLRKFHSQSTEGKSLPLTDDRARKDVMKKTDIYQRAVKLMLHQSDAAKFAMRDGANDQAMVRRLEMLKSVRARQLFQSVSFHLHQLRLRSTSWTGIEHASDDNGMIVVLKDAFQQGRMPILEKVEVFDAEPEVQLTHLSFQELMGGEYCAAIVCHAHSQKKMRAYVNSILSSSSQCLDRERLSESWWLQVWFHVFEMLDSDVLEQYCAILAEDERALLKVGSMALSFSCSHPLGYLILDKAIHGTPMDHRPWVGDGSGYMIAAIHWDEYETDVVWDDRDCNKRWFHGHFFLARVMVPTLVDSNCWRLDGVGTLLRHAASLPDLEVLDTLLSKGVHPCLLSDEGHSLFALASMGKKWQAVRILREHRNDYDFMNWITHNTWWHWACGREDPGFVKAWDMNSTLDQLAGFKPYGTLQKAWDGTLSIVDDVDVNFADPTTGLTPLMLAASCGRVEVVHALIMHRASVNAESAEKCTALSMAADMDNGDEGLECMKLLINARADVHAKVGMTMKRPFWNLTGQENSILAGPAQAGYFDKLKLLLESRADPNSPNNLDFAPLIQCVRSNNADCAKLLVEHGGDFFRWSSKLISLQHKPGLLMNYNTRCNYMSWSPGADAVHAWYMYAAENKDILRLAFGLGMDGNACFYSGLAGNTWLPKAGYNLTNDYWFFVEGTSATFELYVKHGLDINRPSGPMRLNLLMITGWSSNNAAILTHMLENCPDPDEALAYRSKFLGSLEDGARIIGLAAIVEAIEDFKRKRADQEGPSPQPA
ncbi:unnamed protein product [Prorocentrum cordatum]|uniref:Uncharacterized protein n=1 Tax=Prorocentrum cordatum TaxID=2364126 RepID=A0ABN9UZP6_9DINO|nr:unnamed protein product [Polarella glacialis]